MSATLTLQREDGTIICERCKVSDRAPRRVRGLLGRKQLDPDEGMLLRPAWSVHTAFLRFPIDVLFVNGEQVVMKKVANLKPFRTATCLGAREVVELAAGVCDRLGIEAGQRLSWAPRPLRSASTSAEENGASSERPQDPLLTALVASDRGQRTLIDTTYDIGLFTRYLIEGLAGSADLRPIGNGDGKLDSAEIYVYTAAMVRLPARHARAGTVRAGAEL